MTTVAWIQITDYTEIGKYQGHPVIISDLAPDTDKIENFPIKSSGNKVKMPTENGVEMLYQLFINEIWQWFENDYTQLDAFGYFAVRMIPEKFLGQIKSILWNQVFWTQQAHRLKEEGKLTN